MTLDDGWALRLPEEKEEGGKEKRKTVTSDRPNAQQHPMMDGWIDGCTIFLFFNILIKKTVVISRGTVETQKKRKKW